MSTYLLALIVIVAVIVIVGYVYMAYCYLKEHTLDEVRDDVYELILKAEQMFTESESGQQKLKWVVQQARSLLPGWLQVILSEERLARIIQAWFDGVKDLLDDGKLNGSQGAQSVTEASTDWELTEESLKTHTNDELKAYMASAGITYTSRMTKAQLIAAILGED